MKMLSESQLRIYAEQMLIDYDSINPGTIFKDKMSISIEDAWRIQSAVADLRKKRGEEVAGYKIGCVSKETQIHMGFTKPAWGRLWKNELHNDGVVLKKDNYSNPAMEAEFGIILSRDLPPHLANFDYIKESVESVCPVIEIHNYVFNGGPPFGAELLANNAIHAGVVMGKFNDGNISNKYTDLKFSFDKKNIDTWTKKKWPNDILSEVAWLVKEQEKSGNVLKRGDFILTGAFGLPIPLNGTNLIEVTSSLFGNVSAVFE
ncbi:hypothetical protein OA340_01295 [Paracoccaceae bacterium]|nr:hypothetical protein [Paracoccaceae bacterium]